MLVNLSPRELSTILHAMSCYSSEGMPSDIGIYHEGHYGLEPLGRDDTHRLYDRLYDRTKGFGS